MKTKIINAITRSLGVLAEVIDRKAARINRGVEQAQADALDNAATCREEAMEIVNGFGAVAGAKDTEALNDSINKYLSKIQEAEDWDAVAKKLENLKGVLQEEVEVETAK